MSTRKKNICLTINSLERGGAEKQCLLLAKALKPYHNVTLVIMNPGPIYAPRLETVRQEELDHVFLPKNPIRKLISFKRLLKKRKTEIVFSFLPTDTIFSALCGKMAKVPYLFGGIRNSYIPKVKFTLLKFVHNHFLDYTIANNYAAYAASIAFGFKKKVLVVPNGIEIRPLEPLKQNITGGKNITIISAGRLVKQKAYETALKSIFNLKKRLGNDIKLTYKILGQGPEKENIVRIIEAHGLQNEVEIIVNPSDIYALLETSDIYLSTSTFEGISNSILEALNCSLPVVATDAGDNSRLVIHGKNGFITALHDDEKLAQHLYDLIESPERRIKMGLEGYDHLIANFGYEVFQKKYLDLIENAGRLEIVDGEFHLNDAKVS